MWQTCNPSTVEMDRAGSFRLAVHQPKSRFSETPFFREIRRIIIEWDIQYPPLVSTSAWAHVMYAQVYICIPTHTQRSFVLLILSNRKLNKG